VNNRKLIDEEIKFIPELVRELFERFRGNGKELYLIGGGSRKILTGNNPGECDFATSATPEETQAILKDLEPYYENEYGTVGIPVEETEKYEITTYRSEKGYSDYRRPDEVVWGKSLEEDVKRRDFTINTLAIGPNQKNEIVLIDYADGLEDLREGIIRAVGEADERFREDALRMMRAIRQAAQLSFTIEEKTLLAIKENASLLTKISAERVRDELMKILSSQYPADGIRLLSTTGLIEHIIPEILETRGVEQTGHHTLDVLEHMLSSLENSPSSDPIVRLATLLHDVGKPRSKRWRCKKCSKLLKKSEIEISGGKFRCPNCGTEQYSKEATTFYGHEVIGGRMVDAIAERLRLPKKDREKLMTLVRWHMFAYQPEMTDGAIRRFIRRVGKENINDMMLLRIGDRKGGGSKTTSWRLMELQKRIGEQLYEPMEVSDLAINGKDVMEILKIQPGPKVGEILKRLFEEVIEDTSKNNREYLENRVREMGEM